MMKDGHCRRPILSGLFYFFFISQAAGPFASSFKFGPQTSSIYVIYWVFNLFYLIICSCWFSVFKCRIVKISYCVCRRPILSGLLCLFSFWASNLVCFYFIEYLSHFCISYLCCVYFVFIYYLSLNVLSFCFVWHLVFVLLFVHDKYLFINRAF